MVDSRFPDDPVKAVSESRKRQVVLDECCKVMRCQPEHLVRVLERFKREIEEMKELEIGLLSVRRTRYWIPRRK